jgi:DMSO/TMAO reductase YedYZ molybdopterin-dependent catalytic subunit
MTFVDRGLQGRRRKADTGSTPPEEWEACPYDGTGLPNEHRGPTRQLVPHLCSWASANRRRNQSPMDEDEPAFWETRGYHNGGDPSPENRYSGD